MTLEFSPLYIGKQALEKASISYRCLWIPSLLSFKFPWVRGSRQRVVGKSGSSKHLPFPSLSPTLTPNTHKAKLIKTWGKHLGDFSNWPLLQWGHQGSACREDSSPLRELSSYLTCLWLFTICIWLQGTNETSRPTSQPAMTALLTSPSCLETKDGCV